LNQERKDIRIVRIGFVFNIKVYCLEPGKEGFGDLQDPAHLFHPSFLGSKQQIIIIRKF